MRIAIVGKARNDFGEFSRAHAHLPACACRVTVVAALIAFEMPPKLQRCPLTIGLRGIAKLRLRLRFRKYPETILKE